MFFRYIHNLVKRIKEDYNRSHEEARKREAMERLSKIWAEQGKEAKERQASDSFVH